MSGGVHCGGGVLLSTTVAQEKEVSGGNFHFFSGSYIMPLFLLLASPRLSLVSL